MVAGTRERDFVERTLLEFSFPVYVLFARKRE